ncbi:MAG: ATP-binding cassette domain-containing protein, partial [Rhizobiales bacterium]|nr:ATP-binding cassette domain-containing protein [Hyphomicrobiales bacterium]
MTIHAGMTAPIAPVASEATDAPAHVRIVEVSKRLGDFAAVRNISLDIKRGEMLTLLGPSGCGKSTTLRLLAGFYQPTEGEIFLDCQGWVRLCHHRRRSSRRAGAGHSSIAVRPRGALRRAVL